MNFETASWRRGSTEGSVASEEVLIARRRRRVIIASVILALVVIGVAIFATRNHGQTAAKAASGSAASAGGKPPEAVPTVTVVVPGRQQVANTISTTGSLAARRDMPVGVAGEGGMVTRVMVEPGQWVGGGQVLAVIERSVQAQESQQLAASIEVARADARLAQQELDRGQALVGRGFISKADVEKLTAARDGANARVRVAQALLAQSRARIGRLDIRAPAAGLVLSRNVEAGQVVGSGSGALFHIAEAGQMELLARLSQEDLSHVRVGTPAKVTPVGSAQSFPGSIWQVSPIIDPQTRQGNARIAVGYNPMLRPGGFASAEIVSGAVDAPLLPESAVQSDARGNYVYVVDAGNKVARRDVKVGEVSDRGVAIISGLAGNERVVLSAGAFLNPGDTIRPARVALAR